MPKSEDCGEISREECELVFSVLLLWAICGRNSELKTMGWETFLLNAETVMPEQLQKGLLQAMSGSNLRNVDSDGVDQKHILYKTTADYNLDKFRYKQMTCIKSDGAVSVSSSWMFRKNGLKTIQLVSTKCLKLLGSWEENQEKEILPLASEMNAKLNTLRWMN